MTRRLALVLLVVMGAPAFAAERLDLTTPLVPPVTTHWTFDEMRASESKQFLMVRFVGPNGESKWCRDSGPTALTRLRRFLTADLTVMSLPQRTIKWAQGLTPPCLGAGTVSGSPD